MNLPHMYRTWHACLHAYDHVNECVREQNNNYFIGRFAINGHLATACLQCHDDYKSTPKYVFTRSRRSSSIL